MMQYLKVPKHVSTRKAEATLYTIAIVLAVVLGTVGLWVGHWLRGTL